MEEQQALASEKLPNGVKQSVQTMPHLPVGCQDIGQEEELFFFFFLRRRAPRAAGSFRWSFGSVDRAQPCLVDALWVVLLSARLSTA